MPGLTNFRSLCETPPLLCGWEERETTQSALLRSEGVWVVEGDTASDRDEHGVLLASLLRDAPQLSVGFGPHKPPASHKCTCSTSATEGRGSAVPSPNVLRRNTCARLELDQCLAFHPRQERRRAPALDPHSWTLTAGRRAAAAQHHQSAVRTTTPPETQGGAGGGGGTKS